MDFIYLYFTRLYKGMKKMKLIDVLQKVSKGEIENGTILTIKSDITRDFKQYKYIDNCLLDDYHFPLNVYGESDLNREVGIIEPKPKKYYLRLDEDDDLSYINKNEYFSYEVTNKIERTNYKTKFTQEEIDGNMLLKFIEQHGIKEEVEDS